jgi:hypothetical protein
MCNDFTTRTQRARLGALSQAVAVKFNRLLLCQNTMSYVHALDPINAVANW